MISIADGFDEFFSCFGVGTNVTMICRPQSYDIPIPSKSWIALRLVALGLLQNGGFQQLPKLVTITLLSPFFVRELVPLGQLCDTSFERAFNAVPGQVVSPVVHA